MTFESELITAVASAIENNPHLRRFPASLVPQLVRAVIDTVMENRELVVKLMDDPKELNRLNSVFDGSPRTVREITENTPRRTTRKIKPRPVFTLKAEANIDILVSPAQPTFGEIINLDAVYDERLFSDPIWSLASGIVKRSRSASTIYLIPGEYIVTLSLTNTEGKIKSVYKVIRIE